MLRKKILQADANNARARKFWGVTTRANKATAAARSRTQVSEEFGYTIGYIRPLGPKQMRSADMAERIVMRCLAGWGTGTRTPTT
jgi:hypothetical protein